MLLFAGKIYSSKTVSHHIRDATKTSQIPWLFDDGCPYHVETSPLVCKYLKIYSFVHLDKF